MLEKKINSFIYLLILPYFVFRVVVSVVVYLVIAIVICNLLSSFENQLKLLKKRPKIYQRYMGTWI